MLSLSFLVVLVRPCSAQATFSPTSGTPLVAGQATRITATPIWPMDFGKIQFLVDGVQSGPVVESWPYYFDFTPPAAGSYTITAQVTDRDGNISSYQLYFNASEQPLTRWKNFVGSSERAGSADGTGNPATFNGPLGMAQDSNGNLYVADARNHTIRKVEPSGRTTTVAGMAGQKGASDGISSVARFNEPSGVAVDYAGNIYVADAWNHTVRRISSQGVVSTLAGLAGQRGSADGLGTNARFREPMGVTTDSSGNIYVADTDNNTIRRVTPNGLVTTIAGNASDYYDIVDGVGSTARFSSPIGIVASSNGAIYVADWAGSTIRRISPGGVVTTIAGSYEQGNRDGVGSAARFNNPFALGLDASGNIYVSDSVNSSIRKVTASGAVTTLAAGDFHLNWLDNPFSMPRGLVVGANNAIYIADEGYDNIRLLDAQGNVTTVAGSRDFSGSQDGVGGTALFNDPCFAAVDSAGNIFVSDTGNHTIRKVSPDGKVTTVAGLPWGIGAADGPIGVSRLFFPKGIDGDHKGYLYFADSGNKTIRRISPSGNVETIAGTPGTWGSADGLGTAARFNYLEGGLAVDSKGNIFVADGDRIRKIDLNRRVTTFAVFDGLSGLAIDSSDNLFVAEEWNGVIKKVTPNALATTYAGVSREWGHVDGPLHLARFTQPRGIAVDNKGNVFVSQSNHTVRMITAGGAVKTIGGQKDYTGSLDAAPGTSFLFWSPFGMAATSNGKLYVCDRQNNRIVEGLADGRFLIPPPRVLALETLGTARSVRIEWHGSLGVPLNIQRTASLSTPNWQTIETSNSSGTFTDSGAPLDRAFYRLVAP